MPTSQQIRKVINNFLKLDISALLETNRLNMRTTEVNSKGHVCGSVHCHAGWYAVAVLPDRFRYLKMVDFKYGAAQMAFDLGFIDGTNIMCPCGCGSIESFDARGALTAWAKANPELWGNHNGDYMFSDTRAFTSAGRPHGAANVMDIVNHWEEVYARVVEFEKTGTAPNTVYVAPRVSTGSELMEMQLFGYVLTDIPSVPAAHAVDITDPPVYIEDIIQEPVNAD